MYVCVCLPVCLCVCLSVGRSVCSHTLRCRPVGVKLCACNSKFSCMNININSMQESVWIIIQAGTPKQTRQWLCNRLTLFSLWDSLSLSAHHTQHSLSSHSHSHHTPRSQQITNTTWHYGYRLGASVITMATQSSKACHLSLSTTKHWILLQTILQWSNTSRVIIISYIYIIIII